MKIQELLNLDKALKEKKHELEKLRKEVEELKLMVEVINKKNSEDLIDINYVYVLEIADSNTKYFCYRVRRDLCSNIELIDVFSNTRRKSYCTIHDYACSKDKMTYIKDAIPEVNVYPTGKVPRVLLQRLYYRANGIDEKVLKRGTLKED